MFFLQMAISLCLLVITTFALAFADKKDFTRHVTGKHMKEKTNICTSCPQAFSRPADLRKHINRVHLKERPYKCDMCDKAYSANHSLKEHNQKLHSSEDGPPDGEHSPEPDDEDLIESVYE